MRNHRLILLLCLAVFSFFSAQATHHSSLIPSATLFSENGCTLPAPDYLNVDEVGSDRVKLSWNTVNGAAQYRVRILDEVDGHTISTKFVPGNSTSGEFSIVGHNGHPFRGEIISVCSDGSGNEADFTRTIIINPLVIELVVIGFTPYQIKTPDCTVNPSPGCSFTWLPINVQTAFLVNYNNNNISYQRQFAVQVTNSGQGGGSPRVAFTPETTGSQEISFGLNNDSTRVNIKFVPTNTIIASIMTVYPTSAGGTSAVGYLRLAESAASSTKIYRLMKGSSGKPAPDPESTSPDERNEPATPAGIKTSPNPFKDQLMVQLPSNNSTLESRVQLFDLLGKQYLNLQVPADQQELLLPTATLAPGIYFLHVERAGKTDVVKVVKGN